MEEDVLVISEHIGLSTPTVVYHKGERLETNRLSLEDLVSTWRDKWFRLSKQWIVLACSDREFKAMQQRPLHCSKSVQELFYDYKVLCVNYDEMPNNRILPKNIDYSQIITDHYCVGNCAQEGTSCNECIKKDLEALGIGDIRPYKERISYLEEQNKELRMRLHNKGE